MGRKKEFKMPPGRKKIPLREIEDPIEREKERKKRRRYRKQNWRRYTRKRYKYIIKPQREYERERTHDERGYYAIYITKRKKKERLVKVFYWKNRAVKLFNDLVEENHSTVDFPKDLVANGSKECMSKLDMEILLVRRATDKDFTKETAFKNEWGEVVKVTAKGRLDYVILDKADWYEEEAFYCYGYHPLRDKKPYRFIWDNWIVNGGPDYDNTKRITRFPNKIIIKYAEDFNFVVCRNTDQAEKLYFKLMSDCEAKKINYLFFMGEVPKGLVRQTYEELYEKTGWDERLLHRMKLKE